MIKGKENVFEFSGDALEALEMIKRVTKCSAVEAIAAAMNTYLWVLYQQTLGGTIICVVGKKSEAPVLAISDLIEDREAALSYFEEMGW